ncbi:sulfhydrogenase subunit delta [Legionella oakridgensis]|uniref:Coenzyme F420-reducing hydrogenase, gamma subunit n=2 Tax=Legionella oakridgensis TaxID=29423 RepID=W0BBV6_9GAMM|nr:sulfhydrogenase subunit delta [Legionella oakridgensis]AHE68018.1 coenzyme F420-reducing hydrogenase, gamma subunit [Legionella oakridgensis ATCC 33761 = DSM 21215]KTD44581.1 sulfhydrogenase subunit delta [Legionella oakridgensis]STY21008.1 sulfhydrogenase subunit delta [Legionella longbeachae]
MNKPRLAVHKFTSCDGCQLAFLNAGEALLMLTDLVEVVHFAEAGYLDLATPVDITFVEGSVSTPDEIERIKKIRKQTTYLITIGACATAGGIQALRNTANHKAWMSAIYATPDTIATLSTSSAIAAHVKVDWELWGCPVNTQQILETIRSLLSGASPQIKQDAVCMECKRQGHVCVLVTKKEPCMGPVTRTGCGALCPGINRACYACYGPAENPNPQALGNWFYQHGFDKSTIARQFLHINNQAAAFQQAGSYFKGIKIVKK